MAKKATKAPEKGEKKTNKFVVVIVFLVSCFLGYLVSQMFYKNNDTVGSMAEKASVSIVDEMAAETDENGFTAAQAKIQKRSQESIAGLEGQQKTLAVVGGFLALEARFSRGYEDYCKDYGLSSMPELRKYTLEKNKDVHDKAIALLKQTDVSQSFIEEQMIKPMMPQLNQVIDLEMKSLSAEVGQSIEDICKTLEETASENDDLMIRNQRPDIVEIIEDAYSSM